MPLMRFGEPSKTLLLPYLSKPPLEEPSNLLSIMELARGIEPPTCGLQNRCSAIELRQLNVPIDGCAVKFPEENLTTVCEAVKGTRAPGSDVRELSYEVARSKLTEWTLTASYEGE